MSESGPTEISPPGAITLDMISAGVEAYKSFDPNSEEVEVLVFDILYRAFEIARRKQEITRRAPAE